MPYRIADVIETIATYYMVFFVETRCATWYSIPRNFIVSTLQSLLALTTRPSCPHKYRLMPAPYRIVDVIETIEMYYMDFFWRQDVRTGN